MNHEKITTQPAVMTKIFTICILVLLTSCSNTSTSETDLLTQRITHLEQKVDSLIGDMNINSIVSNQINNSGFSDINQQVNRCQAITKKGTQCKRRAKNNGYCWQHGE